MAFTISKEKLAALLREKKYREAKEAVDKLRANTKGRKFLRAFLRGGWGAARWAVGSRLAWIAALGFAGFKYAPELLEKFREGSGASDDELESALDDLTDAFPDRDPIVDVDEFVDVPAYRTPVTEFPEGDPLQARLLGQGEMEDASLALQGAVAEGEAAQAASQMFTPGARQAIAAAEQMRPTGTFARGQGEPTRGMLDTSLRDQYTPSGNIGVLDPDRFLPGAPWQKPQVPGMGTVEPEPQPVETRWNMPDETGRYPGGEPFIKSAQADIQRQWEEARALEEMHASQSPQQYPSVPTAPPTGPEETMEGQRVPWTGPTRIPDLPTAEQAMEGDLDFEAITPEVQKIAETDEIDDTSEVGFWSAAARALGETLKEAAPTKEDWGLAGTIAQGISGLAGKITSGGDVTEADTEVSTGIVLDSKGNILSTGEVAEEGDVSTTSTSAKEGLKEQGKREVVQTNVDATVNKYNLSPPIGQALSQIEKNAGILRAASVMMGVKDISSNYRDMSIGQLRLARDIVEDLNGGQGPWKTWWSPDGKEQRNLPIKGAASQPPKGWQDTNPTARLTPTAQLVTNTKELIKTEGPWAAYNQALSFGIAEGFQGSQRDQHAADLVTMWMKEINPDLPWNFKWPTRPAYNAWANETTSDEEFKGLFGFNFQRLKSQ